MGLHKEGKVLIPVCILIVVAICAGVWFLVSGTAVAWLSYPVEILGLVFIGLVLNFFRNPKFEIPKNPQHILSPCDGKVVVIEEIEEKEFLNAKVMQISVFMSPLNVHVNRNPIGGKVVYQKYKPGKYLMAWDPKSSTDNEMNYVVNEHENGVQIGFKQIAGFLARRICYYTKVGDEVEQGGEMGFIKFGSRVDILVPLGTKINCKLQDVVKGGRTVLAELAG